MTKAQLEAVHEALCEIIDSWNSSGVDDDRGRSNDAVHITIHDDGSGFLGVRRCHHGAKGLDGQELNGVEDWHEFKDLDGLFELFRDQGIEVGDE